MESELVRHLRTGAETVRQLNSAAPEGRTYSLVVGEEGLEVHARQRRHQVKLIVEWNILEASVISPVPGMLHSVRELLLKRVREEDG